MRMLSPRFGLSDSGSEVHGFKSPHNQPAIRLAQDQSDQVSGFDKRRSLASGDIDDRDSDKAAVEIV